MSIILNDAGLHRQLLPLTFTRPVGQLRPGILRLGEGWYVRSGLPVGYRTEAYMAPAFPMPVGEVQFEVDGGLFPTDDLVAAVMDLRSGQALVRDGRMLACCTEGRAAPAASDWRSPPTYLTAVRFAGEVIRFERPWHLFQHCGKAIAHDFQLLTEGRRSQPLSVLNTVVGDPDLIFLSSEPYPFKEKHIAELNLILPGAPVRLVDGELFSWYGSRLLRSPMYFSGLTKG